MKVWIMIILTLFLFEIKGITQSKRSLLLKEIEKKDVSNFNAQRVFEILVTSLEGKGIGILRVNNDFDFDAIYKDMDEESDREIIKRLQSTISEAKIYYDDAKFDEAIQRLEMGIFNFQKQIQLVEENNALKEAKLLLALAYAAKDELSKAKSIFREILILDPQTKLTMDIASPKIIAEFELIKETLRRNRIKVEINANVDHFSLYINGKFYGVSEDRFISLNSIIQGTYHFKLKKSGYYPLFLVREINQDSKYEFNLKQITPLGFFRFSKNINLNDNERLFLNNLGIKLERDAILNSYIYRKDKTYFIEAQIIRLSTGKIINLDPFELGNDLLLPTPKIEKFAELLAEYL